MLLTFSFLLRGYSMASRLSIFNLLKSIVFHFSSEKLFFSFVFHWIVLLSFGLRTLALSLYSINSVMISYWFSSTVRTGFYPELYYHSILFKFNNPKETCHLKYYHFITLLLYNILPYFSPFK